MEGCQTAGKIKLLQEEEQQGLKKGQKKKNLMRRKGIEIQL